MAANEEREVFEALHEKEEGLKSIVNALPFPVAIYNDMGDFLAINPAWCELSGYPAHLLPNIGAWITLATDVPKERIRSVIAENFKLKTMTHKGEFPVRSASGEIHVWDFYSGPVGEDSHGRRLVMTTAVDVTDRTNAENALREREGELALTNRRKDEFLATLAHELRNPLAPIRTGLEVLKAFGDKAELREEMRLMMERQVQQLASLIDDLMEISRISRGKLKLRRKRVLLSEIVQSALEASQHRLNTTHQLSIELPREDLYLLVDPNRLAQVLSNLLNNATQYTPESGSITLRAERIDESISLTVEDTGVGIPEDKLQEIFEPFSQMQGAAYEKHEGLGIGLALAKQLVKLHGGEIWAESKGENQGSIFKLKLPPAAISDSATANPG